MLASHFRSLHKVQTVCLSNFCAGILLRHDEQPRCEESDVVAEVDAVVAGAAVVAGVVGGAGEGAGCDIVNEVVRSIRAKIQTSMKRCCLFSESF